LRVLVLGGTRFVGPHVVRELVDAGAEVTVVHRGRTEADLPDRVRHVHAGFGELDRLLPGLRAAGPEVVVDMVPWIAKSGSQGVLHFHGVARRGLVVTSADVYRAFGRLWRSEPGPPDEWPLNEESPLRARPAPDGARGVDFDNVETEDAVCCDPDYPVTVLRLPATYGPGDEQHRIYGYIRRMDDERPAIVLDEALAGWRWSRGYVEDVGHAIAIAVLEEAAAGRVYNVSQANAYSEAEWIARIASVHGWEGEILAVPGARLPEALRFDLDVAQQYVVDSARIRRELGYGERVSEDEGLRRTIEWERAHPPEGYSVDYAAEDRVLADLGR
jgi:nucleoside-diphosphate-sugar epimerase